MLGSNHQTSAVLEEVKPVPLTVIEVVPTGPDGGVTVIASPAKIASVSAIAISVMDVRSSEIAAAVGSCEFAEAVRSSATAVGSAAPQYVRVRHAR